MAEALAAWTWFMISTWQGFEFWLAFIVRHQLAREVNSWLAAN